MPLTMTDYLLVCLGEECDEVGQRASKALRFGLTEVQPGQPLDNADRIVAELHDAQHARGQAEGHELDGRGLVG